ncbi:MAG: hypothetical protein AAGF01_04000 [Cyanobacteria bacterium P01_G01_bin.38]
MFLDELTPIVKEMLSQPVAFLGGFASGLLRLNLSDDPVKSWLDKQSGGGTPMPETAPPKGPQTISID